MSTQQQQQQFLIEERIRRMSGLSEHPNIIHTPVSIYIPMLPMCITEGMIEVEFSFSFGIVDRVDFTPIHKKPGFQEDLGGDIKSAFVHFSGCYDDAPDILNRGYHYYPYSLSGRFTEHFKYWKLLPALAPVPKTMMNNSQIVANCRILEEKVKSQGQTIKTLEKKLDGVTTVVSQLVGGLFNHVTQSKVIDEHLRSLTGCTDIIETEEERKNGWNNSPGRL